MRNKTASFPIFKANFIKEVVDLLISPPTVVSDQFRVFMFYPWHMLSFSCLVNHTAAIGDKSAEKELYINLTKSTRKY